MYLNTNEWYGTFISIDCTDVNSDVEILELTKTIRSVLSFVDEYGAQVTIKSRDEYLDYIFVGFSQKVIATIVDMVRIKVDINC